MVTMTPNDIDKTRADPAELQDTDPLDARAMPGAFYSSEAFLEFEKEHLFSKEWGCLGQGNQ